jgi:hypothetical protein
MCIRLGLSLLLVLLLTPLGTHAKAPPLTQVAIRGPYQAQPIVITDRATLDALGMDALEDLSHEVAAPARSGTGYDLIRYVREQDDVLRVFDRIRYHVNPRAGWCGYLLYLGSDRSVPSFYVGKWFFSTSQGDAVLRQLLWQHGVPLPQEAPTSARRCRTWDPQALHWSVLVGLLLPLLVALLGVWSHPTRRDRERTGQQHDSRQQV